MASSCLRCGATAEDTSPSCPSCGAPLSRDGAGFSADEGDLPTYEGAAFAANRASAIHPASAPRSPLRPPLGAGGALFVPGTVLAGRYRIVGLLGQGGMGAVYRADDLTLHQAVALKFLPADLSAHRGRLDRFRAEVSISRQVSHPHVCRVYDIGEAEGLVFLSMEYIDGEDLASLLRRIGRLPQDKGIEIARQICAGLAAAHDRGVVHRDLKPGNVMIDGRGYARIADFGLAAALDPGTASTGEGGASPGGAPAALAGTPAYMAPEQFDGRPATIASDIYALGLVLYEIFTGKRAFTADSVGGLAALHRSHTPTSMTTLVGELDPAVERVIARCLEKDPTSRPASAIAVAASLPGGDPLAAALARGETPSPELVAGGGSVGTVRASVAAGTLGIIAAALVAIVVLTGRLDMLRQVPLVKSPDVLENDAKLVVEAFGYAEPPADTSSGFAPSRYADTLRGESWWTRRDRLRANEPAAVLFWYRQSPRMLSTMAFGSGGRVSPADPPMTRPGMIEVDLDSRGRLRYFLAVPPETAAQEDTIRAPDWSIVFQRAGLDPARFTSVSPSLAPPVYADARAAWNGSYPGRPEVPVGVEAAALRGRIVSFRLVHDWDRPSEGAGGRPQPPPWAQWFVPLLFLSLMLLSLVLTTRNLRLGRGDRRGAFRIANGLFVAAAGAAVLGSDLRASPGQVFGVAMVAIAQGLLIAGCAWVGYIALEPYVRRRWPQTLISWARLIGGRWRDPLVGRDVLAGVAIGTVLQVADQLGQLTGRAQPAAEVKTWFLDGLRFAVAWLLGVASNAVLLGIGILLVFFFLTLIVRRHWVAALMVALFFAAMAISDSHGSWTVGLFSVIAVSLLMAALLRFGLVTLVVAAFVNNSFVFPLTTDFSSWYAPSSFLVLAVVFGLALWGAWTSGNLAEVWPKVLGERE